MGGPCVSAFHYSDLPTLAEGSASKPADSPNGDFAVFERGAILTHFAREYGGLLPSEANGEPRVLQWLMFQMSGVAPMMGQANVIYRYMPDKIPVAIKRYQKECRRLFEVLDRQLEGRDISLR
jgi:GST-like protein